MGHMGRMWARLAAYFYKDRPVGSLTPSVKNKTYVRGTRRPENYEFSDSEEEREVNLMAIRETKR